MKRANGAVHSPAGQGRRYWTGFVNTLRVTSSETDGAFALIELRIPPGYRGTPHIHHREHQTDHILQGQLEFSVGEETIVAEAGDVVHCPREIPHAFSNRTNEEAVVYDWLHPGGFDEFLARVAPLLEDRANPPELDMSKAMELAPEYGLEFLPPDADA